MAEKPEFPKRDVVPPNGFEVVLVDPKSPPLLVLVPKPENEEKNLHQKRFEIVYNSKDVSCKSNCEQLPTLILQSSLP